MSFTLLIIEDRRELLDLLNTLLCSVGYQTLTAASPKEGLKLARSANPDLLVINGHLPGLHKLRNKLARIPGLPSDRTVFLVEDEEAGAQLAGDRGSGQRHLKIPFTSGALLRLIRDALPAEVPAAD